jgi:hypothetical protein
MNFTWMSLSLSSVRLTIRLSQLLGSIALGREMEMADDPNLQYMFPCCFPDGRMVPELLTPQEAIEFLRLDVEGPDHPEMTLDYFRREGLLRATRVGKRIRYSKTELLQLIDRLTQRTDDNIS